MAMTQDQVHDKWWEALAHWRRAIAADDEDGITKWAAEVRKWQCQFFRQGSG